VEVSVNVRSGGKQQATGAPALAPPAPEPGQPVRKRRGETRGALTRCGGCSPPPLPLKWERSLWYLRLREGKTSSRYELRSAGEGGEAAEETLMVKWGAAERGTAKRRRGVRRLAARPARPPPTTLSWRKNKK